MKRIRTASLVLLVIIALTLVAIFVQSALPRRLSERESMTVGGWLSSFLSPTALGRWILKNIRKVAHFCEYAFLACEVGALFSLIRADRGLPACGKKTLLEVFRVFLFALVAAFIDETIQIFSGRGPMIRDVWIDLSGFASGFVFSFLLGAWILSLCRKSKEKAN